MVNIPPLLEIDNLSTIYRTQDKTIQALSNISFDVQKNENFGLVGESGCGKSTLLKTVINVTPPNAGVTGGSIRFDGINLLSLSEAEMQQIQWNRISMITQSAMNAMDPVYKVGDQIYETARVHEKISRKAFARKLERLFKLVGVSPARQKEFPHQFSGGMRQRAIIAMSLILSPDLVIADEPTTSLDVIVQDQIFRNIRNLQQELGFSMLLVTHDIALVIENCDRIGVMYGGQMAEIGTTAAVVKDTFHPYTMGLKHSFPNINDPGSDLISIPGTLPDLGNPPSGCRFAARCPFCLAKCIETEPRLIPVTPGHWSACHRTADVLTLRNLAARADTWTTPKKK